LNNNIEVNGLISALIINEVFPNPSSGSEWIEILQIEEEAFSPEQYNNFTISDEGRVIYQFDGNESWLEKLLLIEVSGLNNDGDSVILKNTEGLIIDEMSYQTSKKDLSWLRISTENSSFVLGNPSPLALNLIPLPTDEPLATPTPSPIPSITPTQTPNPTNNDKQNQDNKESNETNDDQNKTEDILKHQEIAKKYFSNYQDFKNLTIKCQNTQHFPNSRLVFLGQKILKRAVVNAIIGSSLFLIAALLLSYEQNSRH
jgi:hypothetical protein